jgi:hypothetical protein
MKEVFTKILHFLGLAFWIEIVTDNPRCTYYFGPFLSDQEAYSAQTGYVEDLENEGANISSLKIKRCKPSTLTIDDELGEFSDRQQTRTLSGQAS